MSIKEIISDTVIVCNIGLVFLCLSFCLSVSLSVCLLMLAILASWVRKKEEVTLQENKSSTILSKSYCKCLNVEQGKER